MIYPNDFYVSRIMEERRLDHLREAEERRLLHKAGLNQHGRLSNRVRYLLRQVGHFFVSFGRHLEKYGTPQWKDMATNGKV